MEATVTPIVPPRRSPTPNPDGYRCEDCGNEYPTAAGLGGHRKVHRKNAEGSGRTPPPEPQAQEGPCRCQGTRRSTCRHPEGRRRA